MFRWFAVLLLILLIPCYGLAGQVHEFGKSEAAQATEQVMTVAIDEMANPLAQLESGAGEGLVDGPLDVQEFCLTVPATSLLSLAAAAPPRQQLSGLPSPVLEGPCRPPRAARR